VDLCGICFRIDADGRVASAGVANRVRSAFHTVEIDFQEGPFPSVEGFRYRMNAIDTATRFSVLLHTRTRTAEEALSVLYYELACKYAWPRVFRCDRDTAFTADLNQLWCDFMGVKRELTPPYHPQGVAFVDASHKLQNRIMRSLLPDDQATWYEMGPVVQKAVNSFVRRNTLFSAEQLLFGFRGLSLVDAMVPHSGDATTLPEKLRLHSKIREIVAEMEGRARGVTITGGEEFRLGAGEERFPVKTRVGVQFRSSPKGTIAKWRVKTKGPYEIVRYLNDATVEVRHVRTGVSLERAVGDLRLWADKDMPEASFEVQAVEDEQLSPTHRFLVRFRGFMKPEWIEATNINCWERVDEFRAQRPEIFQDKILVAEVVEQKQQGKKTLYRVVEEGEDLDVEDARWIQRKDFRNPEIIDLRKVKD
jgi:hypothetical protein